MKTAHFDHNDQFYLYNVVRTMCDLLILHHRTTRDFTALDPTNVAAPPLPLFLSEPYQHTACCTHPYILEEHLLLVESLFSHVRQDDGFHGRVNQLDSNHSIKHAIRQ